MLQALPLFMTYLISAMSTPVSAMSTPAKIVPDDVALDTMSHYHGETVAVFIAEPGFLELLFAGPGQTFVVVVQRMLVP
jgi:hypothetical protein